MVEVPRETLAGHLSGKAGCRVTDSECVAAPVNDRAFGAALDPASGSTRQGKARQRQRQLKWCPERLQERSLATGSQRAFKDYDVVMAQANEHFHAKGRTHLICHNFQRGPCKQNPCHCCIGCGNPGERCDDCALHVHSSSPSQASTGVKPWEQAMRILLVASHARHESALLSARRLGALWFSQIHACALALVAD